MKKIIPVLILVVLGLLVYNMFFNGPGHKAGEKVPPLSAQLINGETFQLADLSGQYVLLDFWGSWCAPCRKEQPKLKKLYSQFNGKVFEDATGFEIVSVALEKSDKYTKSIIEKEGLIWKYHIIDISRVVLLSSFAQQFGVSEVPTKFLISPRGEFMGKNLPFEEIERLLNDRLQ